MCDARKAARKTASICIACKSAASEIPTRLACIAVPAGVASSRACITLPSLTRVAAAIDAVPPQRWRRPVFMSAVCAGVRRHAAVTPGAGSCNPPTCGHSCITKSCFEPVHRSPTAVRPRVIKMAIASVPGASIAFGGAGGALCNRVAAPAASMPSLTPCRSILPRWTSIRTYSSTGAHDLTRPSMVDNPQPCASLEYCIARSACRTLEGSASTRAAREGQTASDAAVAVERAGDMESVAPVVRGGASNDEASHSFGPRSFSTARLRCCASSETAGAPSPNPSMQ